MTLPTVQRLQAGSDFRLPVYRREVFLRYFEFQLRYRAHPGAVYYVLPALARAAGWEHEQRAWAAFLTANTQNPVTTWLLMQAAPRVRDADRLLAFWRRNYHKLAWDNDRRHHKARLDMAVRGYVRLTAQGQRRYWQQAAREGWPGCWAAATAVPTMGRLSAWSYLEYVRLLLPGAGVPDADSFLLEDRPGSRSHRNGLCLVLGMDEWMWWDRNPGFDGHYPADVLQELETQADALLAEARARTQHPDATRLTMESTLCSYKGWHRPRRRYPNVYNDMLYDRLVAAEQHWGRRFEPIWQARRSVLPAPLLLEYNPTDPGCVPAKQNHYLSTGQVIMMDAVWPCFANDFTQGVRDGAYGLRGH